MKTKNTSFHDSDALFTIDRYQANGYNKLHIPHMEQHPVPQNVTTFQFRLIGDMTIKQFGYLCGGAILAFICYKLPLPGLITLPAAGGFLFLGIGFAFIPIEERPMDVWVFSFFKSIYSPTQYVWIQNTQQQAPAQKSTPTPTPEQKPPSPSPSPLSQPLPVAPTQQENKPTISVHAPVNPVGQLKDIFTKKPDEHINTPQQYPSSGNKIDPPQPPVEPEKKEPSPESKAAMEKISQLETSLKTLQSQLASKSMTEDRVVELQKQLTEMISQKSAVEAELVNLKRQIQSSPPPKQEQNNTQNQPRINVITNAETAVRAGLPKLTNTPNVITGIIKDDTANFLPGILVTITNAQNVPMRAFKTNKLGQFGATTPLPNGTYVLDIEDPRERFTFDRVQITLQGKIVPALEILAKGQKQLVREKLTQEIFGKQPM